MASSLIVDIFVSVDGWAGSDGLPGYFGYLGPELQEWIMAELAAPQVVVMGRRTYQALAGLPEEAHGKSWGRTAELDKVVFSRTLNHAAWPNTRICSRDLVDEVQEMKAGGNLPLRTWGKPVPGPAAHQGGLGGPAATDDLSPDRRGIRA
jgi:dihydrofolate reductase